MDSQSAEGAGQQNRGDGSQDVSASRRERLAQGVKV